MTKQEIKTELELKGIRTDGIYSEIVNTVFDAIKTSRQFGYHHWLNSTTCGKVIRGFVFDVVSKDCDGSIIDTY